MRVPSSNDASSFRRLQRQHLTLDRSTAPENVSVAVRRRRLRPLPRESTGACSTSTANRTDHRPPLDCSLDQHRVQIKSSLNTCYVITDTPAYMSCRSFRNKSKQEAQLSQRDRAMLHVIKYFTKSLKVIENDTVRKLATVFLHSVVKFLRYNVIMVENRDFSYPLAFDAPVRGFPLENCRNV